MKKPRRVEVEWDDTWSDSKRVVASSDYYKQPYPMFEVGYLQSMKGSRITICANWTPGHDDEEPSFSRCTSIARRMVRRITYLEDIDGS